jgi:hypothetical protein
MDREVYQNRVNHPRKDHDDRSIWLRQHPEFEVTCIQQEPGEHGHYRISQLGVRLGDEVILLDVSEVAELVRLGKRFYVEGPPADDGGARRAGREKSYLRAGLSEDGRPYVESRADETRLNNLKSLGGCPDSSRTEESREDGMEARAAETVVVMEVVEEPRRDRDDGDDEEREERPSRLGWLWLAGALLLAALAGLGILLAIASSALLAQGTLAIIGIAALFLLACWVLVFRGTARRVYHHLFHRHRHGWGLLFGLLLLFILALLIFPPGVPAIAFAPIPDKTYKDPDFQVSATESDHQPVYFTSSGDNFCTVTKDGLVHINNAGGCAVTALSLDHPKVQGVSHTFAIARKPQAITFAAPGVQSYGAADFAVSASDDSGLPLEFTASGPCAITGSQVHILGAGDCVLTAHQGGNEDYQAAPDAAQTVHIAQAAQTITFGAVSPQTVGAGALAVNASASSNLPVSFTTTTDAVCKASGSAVSLVSAGSCTVTAHQPGDANYAPAADVTQTFQVSAAPKKEQSITFATLANTVYGRPDFGINASASSGLAVSFTADGKCSVDGAIVKITGAGTCTLTAHQAGNDEYNPAADISQPLVIAKATPLIFWGLDEIIYGFPLDASQLNASAWDPSSPYRLVQGSFTYSPGEGTQLSVGEHQLHVVFTPADTADYNGPVSADITLDVVPAPAVN